MSKIGSIGGGLASVWQVPSRSEGWLCTATSGTSSPTTSPLGDSMCVCVGAGKGQGSSHVVQVTQRKDDG